MKTTTITFIGGGNMARNLIIGLIKSQYDSNYIWVTNRTPEKLVYFRDTVGIRTTGNNCEGAKFADVIVLAVEPAQIKMVCEEIKEVVKKRLPLLISVANGIRTELIKSWLDVDCPVVRAMPNTPASVQSGVTGLYAGLSVSVSEKDLAETIFHAVGLVVWLDTEELVNVVAALSGCGPAYVFLIMEALQEAGKKLGLPKEVARLLTLGTVQGAARMALESEEDVIQLRRFVTVPGGSTEQAIKVFESRGIRELINHAVEAAYQHAEKVAKAV